MLLIGRWIHRFRCGRSGDATDRRPRRCYRPPESRRRLGKDRGAGRSQPLYLVTWIPEKVRRPHAFGLINRPDEFVHLVLDALDASVPGEPTML